MNDSIKIFMNTNMGGKSLIGYQYQEHEVALCV